MQAKLNLTAGQRLKEAAREIIGRSSPERRMRVILAVNSNASKAVRIDVARDLERLRSGRRDGLHDETQDLLTVKGVEKVLDSLHIISLDLEHESGGHSQTLYKILESILEERAAVPAAIGSIGTTEQLPRTSVAVTTELQQTSTRTLETRRDGPRWDHLWQNALRRDEGSRR